MYKTTDSIEINILAFVGNTIVIAGDKTNWFNSDDLYQINTQYYFRINWAVMEGNNTILGYIQWTNQLTQPGQYTVTRCKQESPKLYQRDLCMIGDSITWNAWGSYFRESLKNCGLQYNFVGNHTDTFGHQHSGEGGNNTLDVIKRMDKIPLSSHYFILLGTNDVLWGITPEQTVANLISICGYLHQRDPNCKIFLSTLLLRLDSNIYIAQQVNQLMRTTILDTSYIKLIDLYVITIPYYGQWASTYLIQDLLHPSLAGYQVISNCLKPYLEWNSV